MADQLPLQVSRIGGDDGAPAAARAVQHQRHQVREALSQTGLGFDDLHAAFFDDRSDGQRHVSLLLPCFERTAHDDGQLVAESTTDGGRQGMPGHQKFCSRRM